jgi:hypothetical protein
MKKVTRTGVFGYAQFTIDAPDRIIVPLTRKCRRVHHRRVADVRSRSFEKETQGANPESGALGDRDDFAAENAVYLAIDSYLLPVYCGMEGIGSLC